MEHRTRKIIKRRFRGRSCNSSLTYTKDEPYAICFYLYTIFENIQNVSLLKDHEEVIKIFLKNIKRLNKAERLAKVLLCQIKNLEKQNILTPSHFPANDEMCFEDTNIHYYYEQDKSIDRATRYYDEINEVLINLLRVLYFTDNPIFSAIINTTVFSNTSDYSLKNNLRLPKKVEQAIFDISKTQFLIDQVKLSENEARLILFKSRFNSIEELRTISRSFDDEIKILTADMIGVSQKELKYMLHNDQKIKSFGFIDEDGDLDLSMNDCIEEQSIDPYFTDLLKPLDCSNSYSLDSFSANEESVEICFDLLNGNSPVSILFYGKPGSGKTELAKAICKNTGKKIYIFKNELETDVNKNILGRLVCLLSMERQDSIIIVDEADSILKTIEFSFLGPYPSKSKGTINKMLENNKDKVIYIINHQQQIDESTRRRFTFSIKFEEMPSSMLHAIAETKIATMEISQDNKAKILSLLDKYHLTGQSVDNIVKTIEGMTCKDEEILLKKVEIVMKENSVLLNGKAKMRNTVKAEYDPKVLNASMDPLKIVGMVKNAVKFAERNKGTESGIRMLFYGLSGTGKTELGRYISEKLGKQIILKRASDILGKFVGQNEENIRTAFAEAESSGSILLFDEADSFFYDRNKAQYSWERTAVNEFLTQMEEFSGILICTTNLRNVMDPAMQRRFHIMVEFKPMKFDGIKIMAERYFPAYHLSNSQIEELEDMESVTPGDFGVLASRIRFLDSDDINSDYILSELKKFQEEKKCDWESEINGREHRIGFYA
ncbi:MAG: AAA family ATPase [Treponema sp.]|nr:AAA family ATPase [Treponema sp.]